jgi:hypothetical protein
MAYAEFTGYDSGTDGCVEIGEGCPLTMTYTLTWHQQIIGLWAKLRWIGNG